MTVKLTKAMRRVLERMEKGAILFKLDPAGLYFWGDDGQKVSVSEEAVIPRMVVFGLLLPKLTKYCFRISPAGRKALKDS